MTILAVHGAFRGGWSFAPLRGELLGRGVDLRAPSLTGMGERAAGPERRAPVRLSQWCGDVRRYAEFEDLSEILLLGHSQGGLVVRAMAAELSMRLHAVAYLDAPVPEIGQRGVDLMGTAPEHLPDANTWLEPTLLVPDEHHDRATTEWINARLGPTPLGPSLDPVTSDPAEVPTHVAFCAHTPEGYPSSHTRRRLDEQGHSYAIIDAPHDAPTTHPREVADWLGSITSPG